MCPAVSSGPLPAPLEAMSVGEFEPDVWIPSAHPAAGPDRASPATCDRRLQVLRAPSGPGATTHSIDAAQAVAAFFAAHPWQGAAR